jgi:hypothetical protein
MSIVDRCPDSDKATSMPSGRHARVMEIVLCVVSPSKQMCPPTGKYESARMGFLAPRENVLPVSLAPWRIVSTTNHNDARPGRSVVGTPLRTLPGRPRTPPGQPRTPPGQPRTLRGQPPTPPPRPHPPPVAASDPAASGCDPSLGAQEPALSDLTPRSAGFHRLPRAVPSRGNAKSA